MISAPIIEIFCDGDSEIGFGHVRRSASLASYLRSKNIPVRITGLSAISKSMIPEIPNVTGGSIVSIFDSPYAIDKEIQKARQNNNIIVTLDWFGDIVPDVNIAVYPHHEVKSLRKSYIGFEYIIVRDDLLSAGQQQYSGDLSNVVVCLGGGDFLGQGHETAKLLSTKGFQVTLIQGPLAKFNSRGGNYTVLANPSNYAELLAQTDWMVTNGGSCLFEAMYLGKPTFVLPQTEMEIIIANHSMRNGAILGIGTDKLKSLQGFSVDKTSANAKLLVDGKGLERITSIIQQLI